MKNCPDRKAITEVASSCDELRRERLRTSNIAMTVIAALINAEPAASRQPVSRRPDVDVASLSSPDSKLRAGGGRNAKKENQKLRHGGKSAMSLRGRGGIYIYTESRYGKSKCHLARRTANLLPSSSILSFLLTLHLRVLFAAE